MRYLIVLSIFIISCSPSRRIERILKKHPELTRVDSIPVFDTLYIGGWQFDTIIQLDTSFSLIDSFLQTISIDTVVMDQIRLIYRNKPFLNDTIRLTIPLSFILNGKEYFSEANVKFWQAGDKLPYQQNSKPKIITDQRNVPCPDIVLKKNWFDKIKDYWFWISLVFIILVFLYRRLTPFRRT